MSQTTVLGSVARGDISWFSANATSMSCDEIAAKLHFVLPFGPMPYNSIRLELEQAIACGDSQILKPHPGVYVMRANAGTADLLEACGKRQNRPVWGYALQVGRRNHRGGHSESGRRLPIRENLSRCLHPPAECQPCTAPGCEDIASRLVPEHSLGLITCYDQLWNRHGVNWMPSAQIMGCPFKGCPKINFAEQVGLYALHLGDGTVIGNDHTGERTPGECLFEHTQVRLDRFFEKFSFFGFRPVLKDGTFGSLPEKADIIDVMASMLSVLAEVSNPQESNR
jgi:hypothetical protein